MMGKLADMVSEDLSLTERMKISLRKLRLAGMGLASLVETEGERLYRQAMEMGEGYGSVESAVGRFSRLGGGTLNLVLEETQRRFDVLVEEGEQVLQRKAIPVAQEDSAGRGALTGNIARVRPVGKTRYTAPSSIKRGHPERQQSQGKSAKQQSVEQPSIEDHAGAIQQRLERVLGGLEMDQLDMQLLTEINALKLQAQEGDVAGRRPAKSKPQAQLEFDARRQLKGMTASEAVKRLEALAHRSIVQ